MNKKANRLATQKSPYLLQHAYNPVDWFPWTDEAFVKASKEDKPVFLSIGYSTCHWCHVMERESFEDDETANLMNDVFVSIKVDREERPDIDGIYMTVCQMLTGGGGWPLTIIMTPDKKPFFAGTYFPRTSRFNRMGMLELIPRIKELWLNKREEINKSANEITSALQNENHNKDDFKIDEKLLDDAFAHFEKSFDAQEGGFGNAPKFPMPHNLMFLLRYWKKKNSSKALEMVETTLKKMRAGGIYDHVGFGFHRYSTDSIWLVPHFEKMLYDQALLCQAYIETYLATKKDFYKTTAEEILTYVMRNMTSPGGGFYSAEDADSNGEEGKFYLWNEEELKELLGEDSETIIKIFNIAKEGNWVDQTRGITDGTNILHLKTDFEKLPVQINMSEVKLKNKINSLRGKLFEYREQRVRPYKDDKVLTDWNSLMISAFAKAYQAFGDDQYIRHAEMAANFIIDKMITKDGKLLHRYRDGEAALPAHIDDYQFLISALLDLYESSFKIFYLKKAIELNEYAIIHFWDDKTGGFFFISDQSEDLLIRQKEVYDGAVPSGNSVAILNLLRLGRITGNTAYEIKANLIVKTFSKNLTSFPSAFSQSLIALDFAFGPSYEIVISGNKNKHDTDLLLKKVREFFIPNKILILNDGKEIQEIAPFTSAQMMINNKATLYVCRNYSCSFPVTELKNVEEFLYKNNF